MSKIFGPRPSDNVYKTDGSSEPKPKIEEEFPWKYGEGRLLDELKIYLRCTYGEHYVSGDGKIQEFDVMEADGELEIFAKQSARKYLRRYGKKQGRNRKDLLKVLHYTMILLYLLDKDQKNLDLRNVIVTNCCSRIDFS